MRPLNAVLTVLCMAGLLSCRHEAPWHDGSPLTGVISLEGDQPGGPLHCGFSYDLLKRFAKSTGRQAHISLDAPGYSALDSLRSGALDVVAFPCLDSIPAADTCFIQVPLDSCGVWVFSSNSEIQARKAAQWLADFVRQPEYPLFRQPYFDIYNPLKRVSADFISPYDSLFRVYADSLDWDWKLLAALVYQESRFRIEVRSPRGASGLMQLLPETSSHYGCSNPLDPEENIRAGVKMLKAVEKRYKRVAATPEELTKFTLAAYNAGTGRVKDCINYARHSGIDPSKWENVAAVIPEMKQDSVATLHNMKHGAFHGGRETISYVRQVRAYHSRYRHICP